MVGLQRNRRKVKGFQRLIKFSNWLAKLPNKLTPPPFRVLQIGSAFWQSRVLYVATDLAIADVIGDEVKSSQQIAEEAGLRADYLYRLLRMLASTGVFEETSKSCFRNNKLSNCLRKSYPQSVRDMILLHNSPEMSQPWFQSLGASMRSGDIPFVQSHGEELFEYMDNHSEFDSLFTRAMESVEAITGNDYLDDFAWAQFDRLIDVGGSNGKKTITILKQVPQLKALVFDRSQVVNNAKDYWKGREDDEVISRMTFEGGDMMEFIPNAQSSKDLYLFVAIFHTMNDDQSGLVLRNLKTACDGLKPTIAIIDSIAEEQNIDPTIASFDMQMLIGTSGRERTEREWRKLLDVNGFRVKEIVQLRTFARILVAEIK
jgi:hypothetical protein